MQITWEKLNPRAEGDFDRLLMQPLVHGDSIFAIGGRSDYGGEILRSTDGGATWSGHDWDNMTGKKGLCEEYEKMMGLRRMWAASPKNLYACGEYSTVLYSTDAAKTWKQYEPPSSNVLFGVLAHGNHLWVSGDDGVFRRTLDAPVSTDFEQVDTTKGLARMYPASDGTVLIVGDKGALLRIDADGRIDRIETGTEADLGSAVERQPGHWVIVGKGVAIDFDGGGCNVTQLDSNAFLSEVVKLPSGMLFAVGTGENEDEDDVPAALVSEDAHHWMTVNVPEGATALWGACVTPAGELLVTGDDGLIARARVGA